MKDDMPQLHLQIEGPITFYEANEGLQNYLQQVQGKPLEPKEKGIEKFGNIEVLVNNSGYGGHAFFNSLRMKLSVKCTIRMYSD